MVTTGKLTYDDLARFPDDGNRYELVDGEVHVSPAPRDLHQAISIRLSSWLFFHVDERKLGQVRTAPYDVLLSPHDTFEPDIVFVREERWAAFLRDGRLYGPPDLCIEIASPSTRQYDRTTKFARYARFGVAEYWIIDPEARTIESFALAGGAYVPLGTATEEGRIVSHVLPEFVLTASTVFADT